MTKHITTFHYIYFVYTAHKWQAQQPKSRKNAIENRPINQTPFTKNANQTRFSNLPWNPADRGTLLFWQL